MVNGDYYRTNSTLLFEWYLFFVESIDRGVRNFGFSIPHDSCYLRHCWHQNILERKESGKNGFPLVTKKKKRRKNRKYEVSQPTAKPQWHSIIFFFVFFLVNDEHKKKMYHFADSSFHTISDYKFFAQINLRLTCKIVNSILFLH